MRRNSKTFKVTRSNLVTKNLVDMVLRAVDILKEHGWTGFDQACQLVRSETVVAILVSMYGDGKLEGLVLPKPYSTARVIQAVEVIKMRGRAGFDQACQLVGGGTVLAILVSMYGNKMLKGLVLPRTCSECALGASCIDASKKKNSCPRWRRGCATGTKRIPF